MKRIKRSFRILLILSILGLSFLLGINWWVAHSTRQQLYDQVAQLPADYPVAVVLGTSPRASGGRVNLFFKYRIEAAHELYRSGKIKHFILSGDNHTDSYDEPSMMKAALMELGVPESAITLDYAGFRTLDSIVRVESVFDQKKVVVVSQPFHNERALFIARAKNIDAIAYNAQAVSQSYAPKTYLREYLARCKAVLDLYVLGTEPKFKGPKEPLEW